MIRKGRWRNHAETMASSLESATSIVIIRGARRRLDSGSPGVPSHNLRTRGGGRIGFIAGWQYHCQCIYCHASVIARLWAKDVSPQPEPDKSLGQSDRRPRCRSGLGVGPWAPRRSRPSTPPRETGCLTHDSILDHSWDWSSPGLLIVSEDGRQAPPSRTLARPSTTSSPATQELD